MSGISRREALRRLLMLAGAAAAGVAGEGPGAEPEIFSSFLKQRHHVGLMYGCEPTRWIGVQG